MTRKLNPTETELVLLKALWEHGPCTVSQVHALLSDRPPRGYTTILKLLQIMAEKGLVKRVERRRAHVYRAVPSATEVHRNYVRHLLTSVFDNSAAKLVAQALSLRTVTSEELAEVRSLIDEVEADRDD